MARRKRTTTVAFALVCASCFSWAGAADAVFRKLLEDYWSDFLRLNPAVALSVGEYSSEEQFDESLTDAWRERMLAITHRYADESGRVDPARLSDDDRVSFEMLRYRLDLDQTFYGGRLFEIARLLPVNQFESLHVQYAV